jgi:hypothetical protein
VLAPVNKYVLCAFLVIYYLFLFVSG